MDKVVDNNFKIAIRKARDFDAEAIWEMFSEVVKDGNAFSSDGKCIEKTSIKNVDNRRYIRCLRKR